MQETEEVRVNPWVVKIPWRRKWPPTPVFLPGDFHGQRILVGYSPWGCKRVVHDWSDLAWSMYTNIHTYAYIHENTCTHIYTSTHRDIHIHMHTYTHKHTYIYIHTHTHTITHTHTLQGHHQYCQHYCLYLHSILHVGNSIQLWSSQHKDGKISPISKIDKLRPELMASHW